MATQVPIISRDENPVQPASVGRIDYQDPGIPGQIAKQTASLAEGVGAIAQYQKAQRVFAAQNKANADAMALHGDIDKEFNGSPGRPPGTNGPTDPGEQPTVGAKQRAQNGGDPAPIFSDFNQKVNSLNQKYDEANKDADPITQSFSNRARNKVLNRFQQQSATAYGIANVDFIKSTSEGNIKMAQGDVSRAMPNLDHIMADDKTNPGINPIDAALKDIHDAIGHRGIQLGGALPVVSDPKDIDPNTGLARINDYTLMSPQLKAEEQIRQSYAISEGIKSLLIPGNTDLNKVDYMMNKYGDKLSEKDKPVIEKEVEKARTQQEGENLYTETKGMPFDKANDSIQAADASDEAKDYAMKKASDYRTQMMMGDKSRMDQAAASLNAAIIQRKMQGRPFLTSNQFWTDPAVSKIVTETGGINKFSPEITNSLENTIKPLKESTPEAQSKLYDSFKWTKEEAAAKSPSELIGAKAGMSPSDASKFDNNVHSLLHPTAKETDPTKQPVYAMKYAEQELQNLGANGNRDTGVHKPQQGPYSSKDQEKLNSIHAEISANNQELNKLPLKQQQQWVDQLIIKKLQNEQKNTGWFSGLFSGNEKTNNQFIRTHTAPPTIPSKTFGSADTSKVPGVAPAPNTATMSKLDAAKAYTKQFGKPPDLNTDAGKADFLKFMNGK